MARGFRLSRAVLAAVLIDAVLAGLFVVALVTKPELLSSLLPGAFGLGAAFTGNWVFAALLLLVAGTVLIVSGSIASLRLVMGDNTRQARLSLRSARWSARLGALLLVAGLPFFALSWVNAEPEANLFLRSDARDVVDERTVSLFTADQILGAVFVDIPEIYDLRFSSLAANPSHGWMPAVVAAFRALIGLWFFGGVLAFMRKRRPLQASDVVLPMEATKPIAFEPESRPAPVRFAREDFATPPERDVRAHSDDLDIAPAADVNGHEAEEVHGANGHSAMPPPISGLGYIDTGKTLPSNYDGGPWPPRSQA